MDQFVSTYRKDFLWPYIRTFGQRPTISSQNVNYEPLSCVCSHGRAQENEPKMLAPNVYDQNAYMKSGPATPLMDPKLYPARLGPIPESGGQRFNQPNVFLEKLMIKYPFLYEVLKTAPPDDIISRINKNRLATTYEVDYCNKQEYPNAPYDELVRAAGVHGIPPCPEPERLPGDPCRPSQRPLAFVAHATGIGGSSGLGGAGGGGHKFGEKCGAGTVYPPTGPRNPNRADVVMMGSSEYQDAISNLGGLIIRNKLHHKQQRKQRQ